MVSEEIEKVEEISKYIQYIHAFYSHVLSKCELWITY